MYLEADVNNEDSDIFDMIKKIRSNMSNRSF